MGGSPPGYQGICDVISGGCPEVYGLQWAEAAAYAGPLLKITNTSNATTMDIVQDGAHKADMSTWAAFCGGSNSTVNGITTNSHCVVSKIYAEVQGSSNDLVPGVFNGPFGPDCTAGGNACACPFAIEVATGLPILHATAPCEYTLVGDGNATGVTAGTSSLSLFYEGLAIGTTYCCGPAGIGHAYNVSDVIGTTFYLSVAEGQFSIPAGNACQTSTSYCSGLDEESIGDLVDYSPSNVGPVFAAGAFNGSTNKVSSYINGGLLRSAVTPAAALCTGCAGINLPGSVHVGGGGDLSQPTPALMRHFGFTNTAISQSDVTAAYNLIKARTSGFLTWTDFTAPSTAVTVVQTAPGAQNGSGGATSKSISFSAPTGTGRRGVLVGLFWCAAAGCASNTANVFAAGSVAVGSNTCAEVPNSFLAGPNGFQTEVWECANLTNATTSVTVTTDGTSVAFLGVLATEIACPTSGCVVDQGGNGSAGGTGWYCNATTNGNTTVAGEFLYSIGAASTNIFARGTSLNATLSATLRDEYSATGPSGQKYSVSWLQGATTEKIICSGAAIQP
jgi:hypothetical protein